MQQTKKRHYEKKVCQECGRQVNEQFESHFMECEHCLSKRDD
ncbi:MAG TPA: protein YhfH [Massilibacterium sp.]|nr:protein YhfH [Massilibacterium sp.]